ncbi:hypothetical protein C8E99_2796 [Citricoccus muralis]|uniref:Uncharacterized protein n=1 Tax=Citricoccus muralis TaxID=169134 RepID=A0A3D9LEY7_9MICC|nr:hypothetical protein C8E99_2796 [Citricoccus muralis]
MGAVGAAAAAGAGALPIRRFRVGVDEAGADCIESAGLDPGVSPFWSDGSTMEEGSTVEEGSAAVVAGAAAAGAGTGVVG